LRVIGGLSVAAAFGVALWTMRHSEVRGPSAKAFSEMVHIFGTTLFGKMNLFIFGAIWIFVPLATADAVCRERREGTLVLLYLTELRSFGIVAGKAFVHLLRAVSLFLTMAPWLLLPMLFGGVSLRDIQMALMIDFSSVLLAAAAGLLASTIPRDWLKAVILAEVFSLIFLLTMLSNYEGMLTSAVRAGAPAATKSNGNIVWSSAMSPLYEFLLPGSSHGGIIARNRRILELATNASMEEQTVWYRGFIYGSTESNWQQIWTLLKPAGKRAWMFGLVRLVVGSVLVLVASLLIGAWQVRRTWQDSSTEVVDAQLREGIFSPRFAVHSLNRSLSRSLSNNPIGWLQHYSPSARLVKWAWCFFIVAVEIIFSSNSDDLYAAQAGLGLLLLLGLTFSSTGSFRQELETGAFELLLVTPLRERQIITGRLRGLWWQFLPAILVYGAGSIYLATGWSNQDFAQQAWLRFAWTMAGFATLPLIGLYFSVQRWNFFAAWLAACIIGLVPARLGSALGANGIHMFTLQFVVALIAGALLQRRLSHRLFLRQSS
jgi:ABC-type transport system involved in multi-copper enzyme maturation permease subunit